MTFINFILVIVALIKLKSNRQKIKTLEGQLEILKRQVNKTSSVEPAQTSTEDNFTFSVERPSPKAVPNPKKYVSSSLKTAAYPLLTQLKNQWMVWLGGLCISLSGIFLVKYSMDQGYLGPTARVTLGIVLGLSLHGVAEYVRRKAADTYAAVAALAGGGSITLFATLLAGLYLYQLFPPLVVFASLICISITTMWMALLHGPVLAAIGILGAYIVPLLVDTGSHNINGALIYSLVVSASAFLLLHWVYRRWLWIGTFAGGLLWLICSLFSGQPSWNGLYLAAFCYLMLALPNNLKLTRKNTALKGQRVILGIDVSFIRDRHAWGLLVLLLGQSVAFIVDPVWATYWQWLPLVALILWVSRENHNLRFLPWTAQITLSAAIILAAFFHSVSLEGAFDHNLAALYWLAGALTIVFSFLSLWDKGGLTKVEIRLSLGWLSPVLLMATVYSCTETLDVNLWAIAAMISVGLLYGAFAERLLRRDDNKVGPWLLFAAHAAYTMTVVLYFKEATLTLALAFQIVTLTWYQRRFAILPHISIIIKALLIVIGLRLAISPWVFHYATESHWSLWTFGGSFLFVALSSVLTRSSSDLKAWLEGAAMHLFVLFLWAETRYQLYDGQVFHGDYSFQEAIINTGLWSALAICYWWRRTFAVWAEAFYRIAAQGLMVLALGNYFLLLTHFNPLRKDVWVGSGTFFNLLLFAYGLPVIFWVIASLKFMPSLSRYFRWLTVFALWWFVTIEIRCLWRGSYDLPLSYFPNSGELYTYSLVWLIMGSAAFIFGILKQKTGVYRAGLILLGLVIAKIFLVDMHDLTGLYRVMSFMGLGIGLLGLAFLHQYFHKSSR